jgi:Na+-driven multidrug efflux pump
MAWLGFVTLITIYWCIFLAVVTGRTGWALITGWLIPILAMTISFEEGMMVNGLMFLICLLISLLGCGIFLGLDETLIGLYLTGDGDAATAAMILSEGKKYLHVMIWGFLPFAMTQVYASTLKETGNTVLPMIAGISATAINLVGNYILIFGHFGAPAMGVQGAALATVISRFAELAIVALWTHAHKDHAPYICGAFRSFHVPGRLLKTIVIKGMPLLLNEFLWASGMAMLNQCYSTCGLDVVPAQNISSTLFQLSNVVFLSMGNAVGIIMGQMLGAGNSEIQVRDSNRKLLFVSVASGVLFGSLMAAFSGLFPLLYNTTDSVRALATALICVNAVMMPFNSYTNATYFTLRSGGQTMVTFLFDSCFVCCVCVPIAFCLSRFTAIPILPLFITCQSLELVKCAIGAFMLKQGKWIQNLTV